MQFAWCYVVKPIKFLDLEPTKGMRSDLDDAYNRVMSSGQYIGGPEVGLLEQEWADYCEAKYCVSCSSGQDALELLLKAMNIGNGDWVGVPSWTAIATWQAAINVGCRIIPIEPGDNFLIENLPSNEDMVAIIPVHLYGYRVKSDYPIPTIHDACQAHGIKGIVPAVFSFYPTKNLGAYGDGGAIVTNDLGIAERCRELKGSNRLDTLQAAFLRVKLKYLDTYNNIRIENAAMYDDLILNDRITKPPKGGVYHQYVIRTENRDNLKEWLKEQGIETMIHYHVPPHRALGYDFNLLVANGLSKTVLSLPIMTQPENIKIVAEAINQWDK